METKRNVTIQLPRQLDAVERLKFGARPTIGRNKYVVPSANIDALMMHLNHEQRNVTAPPTDKADEHCQDAQHGNESEQTQEESKQNECGGDKQPDKGEQSDKQGEQKQQSGNGDGEQDEQEQEQKQEQPQPKPQQEEKPTIKHSKFDAVLSILKAGEAVYLYGQAGTGKNHLCAEIAKALGVEFYFTNCVQDVFQLKGFVDAKGNYQATQLYQAYTKGGLFMLDEADASDASAFITMNALLANGYMEFPGHTERVFPHPNFKVVACGNTLGKGADELYTGRLVLDGASLDRFTVVPIDYDERVELEIADGDNDLVQFCRKLRAVCKEMQYNIVVSYRTITRLRKYCKIFDIDNAIRYAFTNAIAEDDAIALSGAFAKSKDKYGRSFYQMFNR